MYRFVILSNENESDHKFWLESCEKRNQDIKYRVVNLVSFNWLEEIQKEPVDMLLAKPGGVSAFFKNLYDERITILVNELGYNVYPSLMEILVYENKRFLSYFLKAHQIPSPDTFIFYEIKEALNFLKLTKFPIVAKLGIGSSGKGIKIINNISEGKNYVEKIFNKGINLRSGPNLKKGKLLQRAFRKLTHFNELKERLHTYKQLSLEIQKGYCIFQEFIPHNFEWRVVRIGDSFFAHKKLVNKGMASGYLLKSYNNPPLSILDFVKRITDQHGFLSQAIDIFEPEDGRYLVNEMQCIFGQVDPYQMLVDDQPGRYIKIKGKWVFEKGMYNSNLSYDLRVQSAIDLLEQNNY